MKNYEINFETSCKKTYQCKSATKALKLFYQEFKKEVKVTGIFPVA